MQPRRRPLPVDDEASSDDGALYSPLTPLLSPAAHKVEVDMTIHKIVAERNVLQLEEFAAVLEYCGTPLQPRSAAVRVGTLAIDRTPGYSRVLQGTPGYSRVLQGIPTVAAHL